MSFPKEIRSIRGVGEYMDQNNCIVLLALRTIVPELNGVIMESDNYFDWCFEEDREGSFFITVRETEESYVCDPDMALRVDGSSYVSDNGRFVFTVYDLRPAV